MADSGRRPMAGVCPPRTIVGWAASGGGVKRGAPAAVKFIDYFLDPGRQEVIARRMGDNNRCILQNLAQCISTSNPWSADHLANDRRDDFGRPLPFVVGGSPGVP